MSQLSPLALWTALTVGVAYSLCWTIGKDEGFQTADFGAYYRAGNAVENGHSPYVGSTAATSSGYASAYDYLTRRQSAPNEVSADTFVYAPAYAYVFWPLSKLNYINAARLWMLLNWIATVVCLCLGMYLVVGTRRPFPWGVLLLGVLPVGNFLWANIRTGQVGTLMLASCLGWAVCARRGRPFIGGMLLAAGCALKLAPVLLLPYLVIRRDFRGLAGVVAGSFLLFLVPATWAGWSGTVRLHQEWVGHVGATQVAIQTYRPMNQSCLGLLARLPWISNGGVCYSMDNLHTLERFYPVLPLALAIAVYGWIMWTQRRGRITVEQQQLHDNLYLALLLVLMTVTHVRAWVFNFMALLPACLILAQRLSLRGPRWQVALAALAFVPLTSPWSWSTPSSEHWSLSVWLLQGKFFWQAVVLAIACCWSHVAAAPDSEHQHWRSGLSEKLAGPRHRRVRGERHRVAEAPDY